MSINIENNDDSIIYASYSPLAIFGRDLIFRYFALFRDIPKKNILITRGGDCNYQRFTKNQIDVLDKWIEYSSGT